MVDATVDKTALLIDASKWRLKCRKCEYHKNAPKDKKQSEELYFLVWPTLEHTAIIVSSADGAQI